ncbi:unnamed protein product [Tilletia controversa]|uniref:Cutinase n=3 Tax=Tilletia TaxID=13289 RepID=A0A8X7MZY3_9BASI|nr:hypothetical protein CF335_g7226 [Tilletia laevis]KAE8203977.1 hypothetical protein CF328_g1344 [Tilletia controversa]KAE8245152.1 hypothetical protein A4X03_0g7496 [Tilletia caries]KAE8253708.1 hypothetical protein A4X06_0g1253 [Tilletia controversa]CAD6912313.1 unnamed protein product [Tilletia controversa]
MFARSVVLLALVLPLIQIADAVSIHKRLGMMGGMGGGGMPGGLGGLGGMGGMGGGGMTSGVGGLSGGGGSGGGLNGGALGESTGGDSTRSGAGSDSTDDGSTARGSDGDSSTGGGLPGAGGGLGGLGGGGGSGGLATGGTSAGCHDYVIVESRGTTELQGPSIAFKGMIRETLNSLPGGISVVTQYPATPNFFGSASVGAKWVRNYLQQGIASCPHQKYALIGYSQGAMVSWEAVGDIGQNDPLNDAIKAILLVGDPFRLPNLPGNVDDRGGRSTAGASGIGRWGFPGAKMLPWAQTGKVLDICVFGDMICQSPSVNIGPHLEYGMLGRVQKMGSEFLTQKLGGRVEKREEQSSIGAPPLVTHHSSARKHQN